MLGVKTPAKVPNLPAERVKVLLDDVVPDAAACTWDLIQDRWQMRSGQVCCLPDDAFYHIQVHAGRQLFLESTLNFQEPLHSVFVLPHRQLHSNPVATFGQPILGPSLAGTDQRQCLIDFKKDEKFAFAAILIFGIAFASQAIKHLAFFFFPKFR